MTTLAADLPRGAEDGVYARFPVIASDIIYQGAACGFSGSSGNVRPLVAGDVFAGFAVERCDNSTGAAAERYVNLRRSGLIVLPLAGDAAGDEGQGVYASDDATFTLLGELGNSRVGKVVRIDGSYSVVEIQTTDLERKATSGQGGVANVTFSFGAEGGNAIIASLQFLDANGNDIAEVVAVPIRLCTNSTGDLLEPHSSTLTIASSTDGAVELKAAANTLGHSSFVGVTENDGDLDISITQTSGADTFYLAVTLPNGKMVISSVITFAA